MKAYITLHSARPVDQLDHEVNYRGYRRMAIDYDGDISELMINVFFPVIEEDSPDVVTYISIGAEEKGQGEIFMIVPILPHIEMKACPERMTREFWLKKGVAEDQVNYIIGKYGRIAPHICIANTDTVKLPENLNPIARVAHQLVTRGLMRTAELHPALYEAINDALQNAGVPVLPVVRSSAAKMYGDLNSISLSQFGRA